MIIYAKLLVKLRWGKEVRALDGAPVNENGTMCV